MIHMRIISLFVLAFLVQPKSFSFQNNQIDSLKSVLVNSSEAKERVQALSGLAMAMRYRNTDSAASYAQQAHDLSVNEAYDWGIMISSYNLGIVSRIRGDYDKALENYYRSLAIAEKINDEFYKRAILNALGVVHKIYEENELALANFNEALKLNDSDYASSSIKNNIGEVYLSMDEYDSALKYCYGSLEIRERINDIEGQVKTLNNLGLIYLEMDNYDSAIIYLDKALEISKSNRDLLGQIKSEIGKAMLYIKLLDYDKSISQGLEILPKFETLDTKFERLEVYRILTDGYAAMEDFQKAFEYQRKSNLLADSIFNEEKEKEINLLKLNREAAENELLKNKNELQQVTIQKQKVLNISIIIILGIVFILGMVLLYLLLMKRKTNEALKSKAVELQNANVLKNKMLSIVSHDIKAPLNNLHSLINFVKSGRITETEFQKWIADLSVQVSITRDFLNGLLHWAKYQMSHDLVKKEVVELKPLVASVVEILLPQIEEKGITVNNLSQAEISVKADREVIVLVLKNLLSNAIKFSYKNGEIEIGFVVKEKQAEVSIKDNGVGIESSKLDKLFDFESPYTTKGTSGEVGTGLGLAFCKEFIELNGGRIWVESKQGKGTTFYVSMPLSD